MGLLRGGSVCGSSHLLGGNLSSLRLDGGAPFAALWHAGEGEKSPNRPRRECHRERSFPLLPGPSNQCVRCRCSIPRHHPLSVGGCDRDGENDSRWWWLWGTASAAAARLLRCCTSELQRGPTAILRQCVTARVSKHASAADEQPHAPTGVLRSIRLCLKTI